MRRFGDTYWEIHRAVGHLNETFDNKTLLSWLQGERVPRSVARFNILRRIERRYRLQKDITRTNYCTRRARFMVMISAISARLGGAGFQCICQMTSAADALPSARRFSIGCVG